jgi:hypothetical protein
MSLVRALRTINKLESDTLTGSQLDTDIAADPERLGELNVVLNSKSQRARILSSSTTITNLAASVTALDAILDVSPIAGDFLSNQTSVDAMVSSNVGAGKVVAYYAGLNHRDYTSYDQVFTSQDASLAVDNSVQASNIVLTSPVPVGKRIAFEAGLTTSDYDDVYELMASAPGMAAVAGDTSACDYLVTSDLACNALMGSSTALSAIEGNNTGYYIVLAADRSFTKYVGKKANALYENFSTSAALVASLDAEALVASSSAARLAIAKGRTGSYIQPYTSSTSIYNAFNADSAALVQLANSTAPDAWSHWTTKSATMDAMGANASAMTAAVANTTTVMPAVIASSNATARWILQPSNTILKMFESSAVVELMAANMSFMNQVFSDQATVTVLGNSATAMTNIGNSTAMKAAVFDNNTNATGAFANSAFTTGCKNNSALMTKIAGSSVSMAIVAGSTSAATIFATSVTAIDILAVTENSRTAIGTSGNAFTVFGASLPVTTKFMAGHAGLTPSSYSSSRDLYNGGSTVVDALIANPTAVEFGVYAGCSTVMERDSTATAGDMLDDLTDNPSGLNDTTRYWINLALGYELNNSTDTVTISGTASVGTLAHTPTSSGSGIGNIVSSVTKSNITTYYDGYTGATTPVFTVQGAVGSRTNGGTRMVGLIGLATDTTTIA